jgi:hypothetical protein
VEAKRGFDLSWYKRNHFSLYVDIKMDPIDIFASGDDFIFAQDVIEANIQQSFESEMSKIAILNRCFVTLKATSSRQAEKFLNIPLKVAMRVEGRGTAKEITLEACPPQSDSANAPTKETMKTEMLKLQAKFPVVYRESYKRKDTIPRFWCCSLHEHNPFDEVICLSIDFQIHFNEEKVHKNQLIAWEIIHKWMKDNHNFDMMNLNMNKSWSLADNLQLKLLIVSLNLGSTSALLPIQWKSSPVCAMSWACYTAEPYV